MDDSNDKTSNKVATQLAGALAHDARILGCLLSRQVCSHGKSKYFQRMSMALRALHRRGVVDLPTALAAIKPTIRTYAHDRQKEKWRRKKSEDDFNWGDSISKQDDDDTDLETIKQAFTSLDEQINIGIPEILSRVRHATESLLTEMARGYFLPFCTVALAALARIRAISMRLGNLALMDLQAQYLLLEPFVPPGGFFEFLKGNTLEGSLKMLTEDSVVDENEQNVYDANEVRYHLLRQHLGLTSGDKNFTGQPNKDSFGNKLPMKAESGAPGVPESGTDLFLDMGTSVGGVTSVSEVVEKKTNATSATASAKKRKSSESITKKKRKKKKKKAKTGGDFFDDLFD